MKLGEFFIDLVVNAGNGQLTVKNLVSSMGELEAATVGEIGALWELGIRLAAITDASIKSAMGLEAFHSKTGESTTKLQEWQAAAEKAHVAGETVTSTFDNLSKGLEDIKWGEPTGVLKGAVQILQIDPTGKDVYQVMDAISDRLRERYKDMATRRHITDMIGIPPDMLRLLDMTTEERAKAAEGAYIMSQQQQRTYLEIENKIIDIQRAAKLLGQTIADWGAPGLLTALSTALETIKEIKHELDTGTGAVGKVAKTASFSASGWGMLLDKNLWRDLIPTASESFVGAMTAPAGIPLDYSISAAAASRLVAPQLPTAPAVTGTKTFHNTFSFPGVSTAEEVKNAAHKVMADQSDDTEWLLNRGATK